MKLQSKESDIEALNFQKEELQVRVQALEEKNTGYKQKIV